MATGWRSWYYCATCDGSVSRTSTVCPHCGQVFGSDAETEKAGA